MPIVWVHLLECRLADVEASTRDLTVVVDRALQVKPC